MHHPALFRFPLLALLALVWVMGTPVSTAFAQDPDDQVASDGDGKGGENDDDGDEGGENDDDEGGESEDSAEVPSSAEEEPPPPGRPRLPDPVYLLEGIELEGDFDTSTSIIADALDLEIGQEVNVEILKQAQLRLLATGFFETAQFGLEPGSERGKVIVRVTLDERNTVLLSDVYLGTSQQSTFWGGLDVVDGNVFGIGHTARLGFVTSGEQFAAEMGYEDPAVAGSPVSIGATGHISSAEHFAYPLVAGPGLSRDPFQVDILRAGGRLSFGFRPWHLLGIFIDIRSESIQTTTDGPQLLEGLIENGQSLLSSAALTVELDTRDDPVIPRRGLRVNLSAEGSTPDILSDYEHLKLLAQFNAAVEFLPGHILRFDAVGGIIFGDAPFFERFFVGDFNDLIPSRNLGLNFASRPPVDFFNTGTDQLSYENIVFRGSVEYAIPIDIDISWLYRTEFFLGTGVWGATTLEEDRSDVLMGLEPEPGARDPLPIDLTVDLGLRVETSIGIFGLSFANALTLIPF